MAADLPTISAAAKAAATAITATIHLIVPYVPHKLGGIATVGYELPRGIPEYTGCGRRPCYSTRHGVAVSKANRIRCRRFKTVFRRVF